MFERELKEIKEVVVGDYKLSDLGCIDGLNAVFNIERIGDKAYRHLYIYEKNTYAYCSSSDRPAGYKRSICIYYLYKGYTSEKGNSVEYDIYEIDGKLVYTEGYYIGRPPVKTNNKPCPIKIEDVISGFKINEISITPAHPIELSLIGRPHMIGSKIPYINKEYRLFAEILDVLKVELVEEDGKKTYKTRYLLQHERKKELIEKKDNPT